MKYNQMISLATLFCSAAILTCALLDILLSETQKANLANAGVKSWNVLDELKRGSLMEKLAHIKWQLLIAAIATCLWFGFSGLADGYLSNLEAFFILSKVAAVSFIFTFLVLFVTLKKNMGRIVRLIVWVVAVITSMAALIAIYIFYLSNELDAGEKIGMPAALNPEFGLFLAAALSIISAIFLPWIFMIGARCGLFASEFVVRKIAEYPKGPILATSAIVAAVSAFIKTFE